MGVDNANGSEDSGTAVMPCSNLSRVKRILYSLQLVSEKAAELSEGEYGLFVGWNVFANGL